MDDETKWKYFPFSPEAPYWLNQYNRKCDLLSPFASKCYSGGWKIFHKACAKYFHRFQKGEDPHYTDEDKCQDIYDEYISDPYCYPNFIIARRVKGSSELAFQEIHRN